MSTVANIAEQLIAVKREEGSIARKRKALEDELLSLLSVPDDLEGTMSAEQDGYAVKIVGRINRRVDGVLLQQVAAEHGLSDHLSSLFRWKPEINMAVWKATSPEITSPLSDAIVAKPGRPSFTVTQEQ